MGNIAEAANLFRYFWQCNKTGKKKQFQIYTLLTFGFFGLRLNRLRRRLLSS